MANRTRDYYRKMRKKSIKYKKEIALSYGSEPIWDYEHDGQYSKGKIHCSCEICGFHGTSAQDKRNLLSMEYKLSEYYNNDNPNKNNHLPIGILTLKNKLRKEINGVFYSNSSCLPGTRIKSDKRVEHSFWDKQVEYKKVEKVFISFYQDCIVKYEEAINGGETCSNDGCKDTIKDIHTSPYVVLKRLNDEKMMKDRANPWITSLDELFTLISKSESVLIRNILFYKEA